MTKQMTQTMTQRDFSAWESAWTRWRDYEPSEAEVEQDNINLLLRELTESERDKINLLMQEWAELEREAELAGVSESCQRGGL